MPTGVKENATMGSFHKPKGAGLDDPTYISKEDEAFLVLF